VRFLLAQNPEKVHVMEDLEAPRGGCRRNGPGGGEEADVTGSLLKLGQAKKGPSLPIRVPQPKPREKEKGGEKPKKTSDKEVKSIKEGRERRSRIWGGDICTRRQKEQGKAKPGGTD